MKLKNVLKILLLLIITPITTKADSINLSDYNTLNLEETLAAENIEGDLSNYKETNDQVTIYLFRGQGCSHCYEFLEYLGTDLVKDYEDKFKLVSFEVWKDANNNLLMNDVAKFLGDTDSGVPFIIIGSKTFRGYSSARNEEIKSAIDSEYKLANKKRYDVINEINKKEANKNPNDALYLIIPIAIGLVIYFITKGAKTK